MAPTGFCWNWTSPPNHNGYGQFNVAGRMLKPHRVAYELLVGQIPNGLHLDHLCRNKLCVNPDHLEPVTQAENNRRAYARRSRTTLCKEGHVKTIPHPRGSLLCRTCTNERARERYGARKAIATAEDQ